MSVTGPTSRVRVPVRVPRGTRAAAAGFSLVEVLVAMFVVAMGILALAGLLQAATRYSKMSELRSTATLLANDIADRIRANPVGGALADTGYDRTDNAFPGAAPPPHAACTSRRLAARPSWPAPTSSTGRPACAPRCPRARPGSSSTPAGRPRPTTSTSGWAGPIR